MRATALTASDYSQWTTPQPVTGFTDTLEQKTAVSNKRFYWINTFCVLVLTPPFAFCAVTVITFSPEGSGEVK